MKHVHKLLKKVKRKDAKSMLHAAPLRVMCRYDAMEYVRLIFF